MVFVFWPLFRLVGEKAFFGEKIFVVEKAFLGGGANALLCRISMRGTGACACCLCYYYISAWW